ATSQTSGITKNPAPKIVVTPPILNVTAPVVNQQHGVSVPVLMYHHVEFVPEGTKYDNTAVDLTVSPQDFEGQVQYFYNKGYHAVTIQQVYDNMESGIELPTKPIVFTFDDGYKDV